MGFIEMSEKELMSIEGGKPYNGLMIASAGVAAIGVAMTAAPVAAAVGFYVGMATITAGLFNMATK